jgi:signal transduction histidine kinase
MRKFWRILKWFTLMLYFLALVYILAENDLYSTMWNIPNWLIPAISIVSILKAGITYIKLYLQVNIIEFEFTSIVNHTFRTPLTKIVWALKELKENETNKEKLLYLQNIDNSAERILSIVDILVGMQDVDNKSSYFFKPVSVRQIIEASISKYRAIIDEKKFNFKISLFTEVPPLTADLKKMTFVFDALMENTLWYTPNGGNITIGCIKEKNKVIFYAADSGIGLTWSEKRRLFSKFYRSPIARKMNTDGMGLSLYLSKVIIEKHGGAIYAKSNGRNRGTTFYIELPLDNNSGQIG